MTATSGSLSHSIPVIFQAHPFPADFSVDCCFPQGNGYMGGVAAGENYTTWGWVTSINHFTGRVNLTATINLNAPVAVNPSTATIPDAGTALPNISLRVPASTQPGNYSGTITATNGSITHTEPMTLTVYPPYDTCPRCIPSSWSSMTLLSGLVLFASTVTGAVFPRISKNPMLRWTVKNIALVTSLAAIGVIVTFATGLILVQQGWFGLTCIEYWDYGRPFAWREIAGCGRLSLAVNWYLFTFDVLFYMEVGYGIVFAYRESRRALRSTRNL
ncbi:MAG TPA: hypothetical protein VGS11_04625 [Candidatus Bathyarchaeia archaeon]|nr:hypothetical protein [Candidatus Bathyarchaeia archaeon]